MIHGMWGRPEVWENFNAFFSQRGFPVQTPALRHHEAGSKVAADQLGKTSLAGYASDLELVLRQIDRPPILIGHSMGGLLAQQLASRGLARAVILLASAAPMGFGVLRPSTVRIFHRLFARRRFWERPHRLGRKEAAEGLFHRLPPAEQNRQIEAMNDDSGRALFEIALPALDRHRAAHIEIDRVLCPMLILAGANDRIVPVTASRRLAARYGSRARYVELPEHGHWLMGEPGWPDIAGLCATWLEEIA
jgi:non-heme chloroperoxidase